ncbi:hypothetical protein QTP88_025193 [Uroleucon formosanum]
MDVVTALMDESERRYPNGYQPEDIDNEDEAFNRGMDDFVVLMVSVVVIAPDEILEVQPCEIITESTGCTPGDRSEDRRRRVGEARGYGRSELDECLLFRRLIGKQPSRVPDFLLRQLM